MPTSESQAAHYDSILDDYERHYFDAESTAYREEFIYAPLFDGLNLGGKRVADLASGSGFASLALLERFPDAQVVGFDISERACRRYQDVVGRPARRLDLTQGRPAEGGFDAAMIFGGLHHCASGLAGALACIAAMVVPGGRLLMFEPNRRYFLEPVRRLWYRWDRLFEPGTEAALDHDALLVQAGPAFVGETVRYFGGPAFFLIYNSMIFRLPKALKRTLFAPLMAAERTFNRLPGRYPHSSFVARWRRTDASAGTSP
jgi:SAM-dependent methyltransferase